VEPDCAGCHLKQGDKEGLLEKEIQLNREDWEHKSSKKKKSRAPPPTVLKVGLKCRGEHNGYSQQKKKKKKEMREKIKKRLRAKVS